MRAEWMLAAWLAAMAAAPPDPELLEFLGTFETADGEWVDPLALAELDEDAIDDAAANDDHDATDRDDETQDENGGEQP